MVTSFFFHFFKIFLNGSGGLFASIFCSVLGVRRHVRAFKAATCRRTPNQKSSGRLIRSILKLFSIHKGGRGIFCEPRGRAPFVIFRQRNNAVPRWIMMDVIQPRQIRALECDAAFPKLKPNSPFQRVVPKIKLPGRLHVKFTEKFPQRARTGW